MIRFKLLFCIDSLHNGGAEKMLVDYLWRLDVNLYDITLYVLYDYGVYFDSLPQSVRWVIVSKATVAERSIIEQECFDLEIAFLEGQATRYIASRNTTAIKIAWIHTDLEKNNWCLASYNNSKEQQKACYLKMHQLVFVSKYSQQKFIQEFSFPKERTIVIHNVLEANNIRFLARKTKIRKEGFIICAIGRFIPEKRFDLLIESIALLAGKNLDFKLLIIGDGPELNAIQSQIDCLQLNRFVQLKGYLPNPYPYIANADLILSTSDVEGYPLVILEALCLGCPVVATHSGGADEVLEDGKWGDLVDGDACVIADKICDIMLNSDQLKELQSKALLRKSLFINHDFSSIVGEYIKSKASQSLKNSLGMYGTMREIIQLHIEYVQSKDIFTKRKADELMKWMYDQCSSRKQPWAYGTGLCGIGVGLEYLLQAGFYAGNSDILLAEIDKVVFFVITNRPTADLSVGHGILGIALYLYYRLCYRMHDSEKDVLDLKENMIYLIDWISDCLSVGIDKTVDFNEMGYVLSLLKNLNVYNSKIDKLLIFCEKCRLLWEES